MKWNLEWTVHRIVSGKHKSENYSQTETHAQIFHYKSSATKRMKELKSIALPNTKELTICIGLFELTKAKDWKI